MHIEENKFAILELSSLQNNLVCIISAKFQTQEASVTPRVADLQSQSTIFHIYERVNHEHVSMQLAELQTRFLKTNCGLSTPNLQTFILPTAASKKLVVFRIDDLNLQTSEPPTFGPIYLHFRCKKELKKLILK